MFLEGKTLELMLAAVVALVVVGPKDLPVLLRRFGQFMARLRGMAAEFRASFDEMARQSELDELRKEVDALRRGQIAEISAAANAADITKTLDDIHQGLADVGVQLHPPMSYQHLESAAGAPGPEAISAPAAEPTPAKPKRPRAKAAAKSPAPKGSSPKTGSRKPATGKSPGAKPKTAAKPRAKTSGPPT